MLSYNDMLVHDFRLLIFNNDHRPTNSATITRNVDSVVMMINVDADEFTESPGATQFPKVLNKTSRILCQTNDATVDVHDKTIGAVNLGPSRETDVCKNCDQDYDNADKEMS